MTKFSVSLAYFVCVFAIHTSHLPTSPHRSQCSSLASSMLHNTDPTLAVRGVGLPPLNLPALRKYILHLRPSNAFVMIANPAVADALDAADARGGARLDEMELNSPPDSPSGASGDSPDVKHSLVDTDLSIFSPGVWDDHWQKERWVSVRFREACEVPLAIGCMHVWDARGKISGRKAPLPLPSGFDVGDLSLPTANPYIPRGDAFMVQTSPSDAEVLEPWQAPHPIAEGVWLCATGKAFEAPLGVVRVALLSPDYPVGPSSVLALQLFADCLRDTLNTTLYCAALAKLDVQIQSASRGIVVTVGGFASSLAPLLTTVLHAILRAPLCRQQAEAIVKAASIVSQDSSSSGLSDEAPAQYPADAFGRVLQTVTRGLRNVGMAQPYMYTLRHFMNAALQHQFQEVQPQLAALESCMSTAQQMEAFVEVWRSGVVSFALLVGAWTDDSARALVQQSGLRPTKAQYRDLLTRAVLPPLGVSQSSRALSDPDNVNHCVAHVMYCGLRSLKEAGLRWVVQQALQGAFFGALRTQEQTGYVNHLFGSKIAAMGVIVCGVQSSIVPPLELAAKFDAFMDGPGLALFENMQQATLCQLIGALIGLMREQPMKNADLMEAQWPLIAEFRYSFDDVRKQIELAQQITREDIVAFYKRYLTSKSPERRLLRLIAVPAGVPLPPIPKGVYDANDLPAWKAMQTILPAFVPS